MLAFETLFSTIKVRPLLQPLAHAAPPDPGYDPVQVHSNWSYCVSGAPVAPPVTYVARSEPMAASLFHAPRSPRLPLSPLSCHRPCGRLGALLTSAL